jgi:hypothetical protein
MKVGDLVKIQDVSRSPTDMRLFGVILKEGSIYQATVMWQSGIIGTIPVHRLEVISESRRPGSSC